MITVSQKTSPPNRHLQIQRTPLSSQKRTILDIFMIEKLFQTVFLVCQMQICEKHSREVV